MLGCELTKLDNATLELITNDEVLRLVANAHGAVQLEHDDVHAIWQSLDNEDNIRSEKERYIKIYSTIL